MVPGADYDLHQIYEIVAADLALSASDRAFDGFTQTRWERNVRNLLQARVDTGHIIRSDRATYSMAVQLAGTHQPSPAAERSSLSLHSHLLNALGKEVTAAPDLDALRHKPLLLSLRSPLSSPAACFVYLATDHPAERSTGDYRIQVTLAGHRSKQRAHFNAPAGHITYLVGYVREFDVFVLWDAAVHDTAAGVPYSKGVQVHAGTIYEAVALGVAHQSRRLRVDGGGVVETVIAARASRLREALMLRDAISMERLLGGGAH